MTWWEFGSNSTEENDQPEKERRKEPRIGAQLKFDTLDRMKTRLSWATQELSTSVVMGLAFRVDQIFKLGMKLALFLKLPDTRETLCIPQAYVSWINGRRFGVELRATRQEDHSGSSSNAWPVRGERIS